MYGLRNHAPGMQVHAVPEAERAFDQNGRRLPWGYDFAAGAGLSENGERQPVEKGPFGRSIRRSRSGASRSRSKTVEPRREEDKIRAENMAAEDAIFGSMRRVGTKDDGKRDALGEVDPNAVNAQPLVRASSSADSDGEPTEVLLYGFGEDLQWAAIDFYERVSNGYILEDYDRTAPGERFDISRTLGRQAAQKGLSRAAIRKKNKFAGGDHWIKVTFDSKLAAELATARAPHTIRGYLVYAEMYQGRGPHKDEPILATQAGAQITSDALPPSFSTHPMTDSPNGSSTLSSATATGPATAGTRQSLPSLDTVTEASPTSSSSTLNNNQAALRPQQSVLSQQATGVQIQALPQQAQVQPRRLRIEGATRATVLPAELALAPKQPKASWSSWLGASEIIGSAVPRKADGTFDWDTASLYWRLFYVIDQLFGTDFCGMKLDE